MGDAVIRSTGLDTQLQCMKPHASSSVQPFLTDHAEVRTTVRLTSARRISIFLSFIIRFSPSLTLVPDSVD